MAQTVGLAAALVVVWLLLSGHYTGFVLTLGALAVLFCLWFARRMDLIDREGVPVHITAAAIPYNAWLMWEIVKANIDVTKRVLGLAEVSPTLVNVRCTQRTDLGQVIYANSITLTPGTVSLYLEDGVIEVHAISRDGAESLLEGDMDRRVTAMEGA